MNTYHITRFAKSLVDIFRKQLHAFTYNIFFLS